MTRAGAGSGRGDVEGIEVGRNGGSRDYLDPSEMDVHQAQKVMGRTRKLGITRMQRKDEETQLPERLGLTGGRLLKYTISEGM